MNDVNLSRHLDLVDVCVSLQLISPLMFMERERFICVLCLSNILFFIPHYIHYDKVL